MILFTSLEMTGLVRVLGLIILTPFCFLCLASCDANSQKFTISTDHTTLVASKDKSSNNSIPLDRTVSVKNGNQSAILYYDADRSELRVFVSKSANTFRLVAAHVFEMPEPTCIIDASYVGDGVILVALHLDPTNSWFALCDTNANRVRAYFGEAFACDESGTQIAFITGQPHFGENDASVFVNGCLVAKLVARDYWNIQWDKQLTGFVLINSKQERIRLYMPNGKSLETTDPFSKSPEIGN
jgi:hypothetical protein